MWTHSINIRNKGKIIDIYYYSYEVYGWSNLWHFYIRLMTFVTNCICCTFHKNYNTYLNLHVCLPILISCLNSQCLYVQYSNLHTLTDFHVIPHSFHSSSSPLFFSLTVFFFFRTFLRLSTYLLYGLY